VLHPLEHLTRARLRRAAAVLALLAGYAALASGDVTLAPLLLVAAYVILVPFALLAS
jgi:hypothetical protein